MRAKGFVHQNTLTGGHTLGAAPLGSLKGHRKAVCAHQWRPVREDAQDFGLIRAIRSDESFVRTHRICRHCKARQVFSESSQRWFNAHTDRAFFTKGFFE